MADKTTNYELVKPLINENYDIGVQNGNMDIIDAALTPSAVADKVPAAPAVNSPTKLLTWLSWILNRIKAITGKANWWDAPVKSIEGLNTDVTTHLADYVRQPGYSVTTGTNAYTVSTNPAPTAYVDGMGIVINVGVANTGASSINWNGLGVKSIVDSKGAALISGKLKVGGRYTLRYSSSAGNFQLQGEGGDYGTATQDKVLTGSTLGTEIGVIPGTMPDRGVFNLPLGATVLTGYYSGGTVPNGAKYATGTATLQIGSSSVLVSGLAFEPKTVLYHGQNHVSGNMYYFSRHWLGFVNNASLTKGFTAIGGINGSGSGGYTTKIESSDNVSKTTNSFYILAPYSQTTFVQDIIWECFG